MSLLRPFTALCLLSAFCLVGCADDTEDTTNDTPPATPVEYTVELTVTDGVAEDGIAGIEVCFESPVGTEVVCNTTDDNGVIESVFTDPVDGPTLTRLSGDGYMTTLGHGRIEADVLENWDTQMVDNGKVQVGTIAVSELILTAALSPLGEDMAEGKGSAFVVLTAADDTTSLAGATLTVHDSTGAEAGVAGYADETGLAVDPDLTATSASGGFGVINLDPGAYTVKVELDGFTCGALVSWPANDDGSIPFVVEADSVSTAGLRCNPN